MTFRSKSSIETRTSKSQWAQCLVTMVVVIRRPSLIRSTFYETSSRVFLVYSLALILSVSCLDAISSIGSDTCLSWLHDFVVATHCIEWVSYTKPSVGRPWKPTRRRTWPSVNKQMVLVVRRLCPTLVFVLFSTRHHQSKKKSPFRSVSEAHCCWYNDPISFSNRSCGTQISLRLVNQNFAKCS